MDRHIEDYLKQHHCRDYFNSYGETVKDDHYFMYREEVYGLIELIVRECARIARATPAPDFDDLVKQQLGHTWDMAAIEAGRQIIKHFGVE
jgi:hypothetical protein